MTATTLMVQGTASDAGKSTLVAGLGRAWYRRGAAVAPFKPQNMALNSAVAADGGEIARAQAVQAQACGVAPATDMSPVLIKPASDTDAQVIIHGRPVGDMSAVGYQAYKATAMKAVLESHRRLCQRFDRVLVEGAGSPAEINLRDNDIANMGFAETADCPVLLVADIDKGGVFAQIVGTLELVSRYERDRIIGFVINRFRGDIALLQPGLDWLEARTGKPVFGVLPYLQGLHLEAEDAIRSEQRLASETALKVQVPVLPRISNHTDFDALRLHPGVNLQWVGPGREPGPADLIILPGSKNVRADLAWLREQGWETHIRRHLRYGGKLLGICGGYQMLGRQVADPHGVEGQAGNTAGLGLLALATELGETKHLQNVTGALAAGGAVCGYRIHCGRTEGDALANPFLQLQDGPDGAVSADNQIAGTYLHGLFDTAEGCNALMAWAGLPDAAAASQHDIREAELNRLADAIEAAIDLDRLP